MLETPIDIVFADGIPFKNSVFSGVGHARNRPLAEFVVQNEERTDMYLINYGKVVKQERMAALQERDPETAERLVIYHAQSLCDRFTELFNEEIHEEDEGEVS